PSVQALAFSTSSQSRAFEHSQRPDAVLQCETPAPPQSSSRTHRQRRVVESHTEPFLSGVQSELVAQAGTQAPSAHVRLALPQTSAVPAAPNLGRVISS